MMRSSRRTTQKKLSEVGSWGRPVRTTRPPGRQRFVACSTASAVPAVSMTRSTPSRPEKARAAAVSSSAPESATASAPSSRASPRRRVERATASTRTPRARSVCTASRPSEPRPSTAAVSPASGAARPTARTTTASGSARSRRSSPRPAGAGPHTGPRPGACSADPPPPAIPLAPRHGPASVPIGREGLAGLDWLALRTAAVFYGCGVPRGDGAGVVLVPGFLGTDWYLLELHGWLGRLGYRSHLSRIGRNAECLDLLSGRLLETVERAREATGQPVHLIGHRPGGMLTRSLATRRPDLVASAVTLGSPFPGVRPHPLVLLISG